MQTPSPSPAQGPSYDVVSIKRNQASLTGRLENPTVIQRPDGGFTQTRVPIGALIARAYSSGAPADMVGLPDWAMREYYDVSATSTLAKATAEDRIAMLRAMLADRVKLAAHFEKREQPVYDPAVAPAPDAMPTVFIAIREQLGLELKSSRAELDTLVIDHLERPTEN
jgi:uncharacterized protein (TIGR03435 family)